MGWPDDSDDFGFRTSREAERPDWRAQQSGRQDTAPNLAPIVRDTEGPTGTGLDVTGALQGLEAARLDMADLRLRLSELLAGFSGFGELRMATSEVRADLAGLRYALGELRHLHGTDADTLQRLAQAIDSVVAQMRVGGGGGAAAAVLDEEALASVVREAVGEAATADVDARIHRASRRLAAEVGSAINSLNDTILSVRREVLRVQEDIENLEVRLAERQERTDRRLSALGERIVADLRAIRRRLPLRPGASLGPPAPEPARPMPASLPETPPVPEPTMVSKSPVRSGEEPARRSVAARLVGGRRRAPRDGATPER